MVGDIILRTIAGFLIPFLLLYGFFSLSNYAIFGFFSIINSVIYFLTAYILYYIRYNKIKTDKIIPFKFLIAVVFIALLFFLFYIISILLNIGLFYE